MTSIRLLSPTLINQIAAGEVIERPASALKELVENAIDAGATRIDVVMIDGGKSYMSVTDNGKGMSSDELTLAVERHATSKLPEDDLFNIHYLGFRGEALPSIGSVARLTITSKQKDCVEAWSISVEGGVKQPVRPAGAPEGTKVEVRDLFFATPARLKFLKSTQTELGYAKDVLHKLAMIHPEISFSLSDDKRQILKYLPAANQLERVAAVMGKDFKDNAIEVHGEHEGVTLDGFISLPTYTRSTSTEQYLFVNGRWVKDKMLFGCVKGAYQGLMGHGSDGYPVLALFLNVPCHEVDVNVHPAKSEVRFKDAAPIRGLIVGTLKNALAEAGHRTSTTIGIGALGHSSAGIVPHPPRRSFTTTHFEAQAPLDLNDSYSANVITTDTPVFPPPMESQAERIVEPEIPEDFPPLGLARAQVHETYIISQTPDSIIITDQHAAHERLTYEKIRKGLNGKMERQLLLIPEVVSLSEEETHRLLTHKEELETMGLLIDAFGLDAVVVREIPAVLGEPDIQKLMKDIADTLLEYGQASALEDRIQALCARMACHGSVRSGRVLDASEMNALLRQMENCGTSGQCIHGRPTYIELKLKDIEKLFGRRG